MFRLFHISSLLVVICAVALLACSDDEEDGESAAAGEATVDAGYDAEHEQQQIPSVESIDFESTESGTASPRIHVESSTQRGVIAEDPSLAADTFLDRERARKIIGDADIEVLSVAGQNASPTQNSIRYVPAGGELDLFGVGLQIWDLSDAASGSSERLAELREQFLNVDDADGENAPDGAFTSRRAGIRNLIFTGEEDPYIFVLSCDVDHCEGWDEMVELGAEIAAEH